MPPRERRYFVRRDVGGVLARAIDFREGEEFVTCITRTPGVVLEVRPDGVTVQFSEESRRLHPRVLLEHA